MKRTVNVFAYSIIIDLWLTGLAAIEQNGCSNQFCNDLGYCTQEFRERNSERPFRNCICTKNEQCQFHLEGCFYNGCLHGFYGYSESNYRCICSHCKYSSDTTDICNTTDIDTVYRICKTTDIKDHCNINACALDLCKNGQCVIDRHGYRCDCHGGYTGTNCERDMNECESNPCVNGNCTDELNGHTCTCFNGFEGEICDKEINECESNPCINGNCTDEVNGYLCTCFDGFEGTTCDKEETCETLCDCEYANRLKVLSKVNAKPIHELEEEMKQQLNELKQNLTVDRKTLSSSKRKKVSASDKRKSSEQIGVIGTVFLSIVFGLVILIDLVSLKTHIDNIRFNWNSKQR